MLSLHRGVPSKPWRTAGTPTGEGRCGVTIELPICQSIAEVSTDPAVDQCLAVGDPVAIGVSGGKDSAATVLALAEYLDKIAHTGSRVLIHSDLGVVEWPESIEWCHKLAEKTGYELIVVRRSKGDMMDRWEQRWHDNVLRYETLSCVQIILPWSTPGMRFCTSEMKVGPICRELIKRFPGNTILSVSGIRRDESSGRKNAPISKPQPKLKSSSRGTSGIDWHPIADWTLQDVFAIHKRFNFPLHPAYTRWGSSRVSCMQCIMQSEADADAVSGNPASHAVHRRIVDLEIRSTFAFQGNRWRGDVAPGILTPNQLWGLQRAKEFARSREEIEGTIPEHLLYTKGWPNCIPTKTEAEHLASVRRDIATLLGLPAMSFIDGPSVRRRYQTLMRLKNRRAA